MSRLSEYLLLLYSLTGTISIAISQSVMAGGALVAGVDRGRTIRWRRTGLEWPVAAWTLAALIATVFAEDPLASLDKMRKVLLFGMFWWAPAVVSRRWGLGRLHMGLLFGAGTTSLYGVLTFFLQGGPELAVRIDGFQGFYLTNHGLLLLCTFPAVLFATCSGISTSYRWGAGLAAGSILAAQLLGRLPGAWLGTAAGFCFLSFRRRKPVLALAVVVVAVGLQVVPGIFREAACDMLQPSSDVNRDRSRVWSNAWQLIRTDPLTGLGLQDLRGAYARVKRPGEPGEGHMGSVPVQIAVSMGLPGLLAFGWVVATIFRRLGRARRSVRGDGFLVSAVDGAEAGVVAFLAAGLVEWNLGDSEILALLCFLVGTGIAAERIRPDGDRT